MKVERRHGLVVFLSSPILRWGVGLALSIISLYFALRSIHIREVGNAFLEADGWFLILLLVNVLVNNLSKAIRWQVFIGSEGIPVSVWVLLMAHLSGQMLNTLYPGRFGELSRAYVVGGMGPGRAFIFGTLVLEKLFDLVFYAASFMFLLFLISPPGWLGGTAGELVVATVLLMLVVVFLLYYRDRVMHIVTNLLRRFPVTVQDWLVARIQSGITGLSTVHHRDRLLRAILWSVVIWVTGYLNIYFALLALHTQVPLAAILLTGIALLAGISIPVPAKFGLFSYICVLSLAVYGIDQATAFSCSLLLQGLVTLPIVVFGLLSFWALGLSKKKVAERQPPIPVPPPATGVQGRIPLSPGPFPLKGEGEITGNLGVLGSQATQLPLPQNTQISGSSFVRRKEEAPRKKINILGVGVDPVSVEEVLEWLAGVISAGKKGILANVHVAGLNIAYEQAWFRQFLNDADLVTCDGMGVKLGAALLGQRIPWRFANTDLIWPVAALAQEKGYSLFLLGNPPGVAERAARKLREGYPGIRIVGTHHGYFDKTAGSLDTEAVVQQVNATRPDLLFVGFGMPVQEKWLTANWARIDAHVAIPTGALFEYISGDLRRGPRWMTEHYMEWLARLVISPRRYWKRYMRDNPLFLYRLLKQRWFRILPK